MNHVGTVVKWKDEEGYGFIRADSGGGDIFLHVSSVKGSNERRPEEGSRVEFVLDHDEIGRPFARFAIYEREHSQPARPPQTRPDVRTRHQVRRRQNSSSVLAALVAAGFFAGLALCTWYAPVLPVWIIGGYALMSYILAATYRADKRAAEAGKWRVPESTLLFRGLMGGWPGALIAQSVWRHKSLKPAFQSLFRFTIVANMAALLMVTLAASQINSLLTTTLGPAVAKPLLFPSRKWRDFAGEKALQSSAASDGASTADMGSQVPEHGGGSVNKDSGKSPLPAKSPRSTSAQKPKNAKKEATPKPAASKSGSGIRIDVAPPASSRGRQGTRSPGEMAESAGRWN